MTNDKSLMMAEEAIKPFLPIFKDCYDKAIKKYNDLLLFFADTMYNRTKAANFQNIIVIYIKEALANYPKVVIKEKYETVTVIIDNYVYARFKKLNAQGFPSNVRTKRNAAIIAQQMELEFSDAPPLARIDVGYKLDQIGTDYEMLKVICRKGKTIMWDLYFHDINNKDETGGVEIQISPITPKDGSQTGRVKFPKEHKKINNG